MFYFSIQRLKIEIKQFLSENFAPTQAWKWDGLEEMIPMMYHTWVEDNCQLLCPKKFVMVGWQSDLVSALYLSLRDKERLKERENIERDILTIENLA